MAKCGVPQGDCMYALFFILYIAQTLKPIKQSTVDQEHSYTKPRQNIIMKTKTSTEQDHTYNLPTIPTAKY